MGQKFPEFSCEECQALVAEWLDARARDVQERRERFLKTARSTGRQPDEMLQQWLSSIARMSDAEIETVKRALDVRADGVRRKWSRHEVSTGHRLRGLASAVVLGYMRPPV